MVIEYQGKSQSNLDEWNNNWCEEIETDAGDKLQNHSYLNWNFFNLTM